MKARTLARLELMAAAASLKLREELLRHNTVLGQSEYQKAVLTSYRVRLSESWRDGAVVTAGQARRAEVFVTASDAAAGKIEAEAERARVLLDEAVQGLARNQQRRRGLAAARRRAEVAAARELERREEPAAAGRRKEVW